MQVYSIKNKNSYIDSTLTLDISFPVKNHRPLLEPHEVSAVVEASFRDTANQWGCTILHLQVNPSNVRMRVQVPADLAPLSLTTKLKTKSSHALYARFPGLKSKTNALWSWAVYLRSVGSPLPGGIDEFLARDRGIHNAAA